MPPTLSRSRSHAHRGAQRDRRAHGREVQARRGRRVHTRLAAKGAFRFYPVLAIVAPIHISFVPLCPGHRQPEEPPRPPSPGPPPPPSSVLGDGPARPAWRTVHKRENRQKAKAKALPPPDAPPPALHAPPPNLPAWAQWKRQRLSLLQGCFLIWFLANSEPATFSPAPYCYCCCALARTCCPFKSWSIWCVALELCLPTWLNYLSRPTIAPSEVNERPSIYSFAR